MKLFTKLFAGCSSIFIQYFDSFIKWVLDIHYRWKCQMQWCCQWVKVFSEIFYFLNLKLDLHFLSRQQRLNYLRLKICYSHEWSFICLDEKEKIFVTINAFSHIINYSFPHYSVEIFNYHSNLYDEKNYL